MAPPPSLAVWKLRGSTGSPSRVVKTKPQSPPHVTGREPSPGLLDPVPLECLHRDLWQRQRGIRGRRLRVPPPVDPLDLRRNERIATGQVDVLPGCSYAWGWGRGPDAAGVPARLWA